MASAPSQSASGPFERVASPAAAVDRLSLLYDEATQALRGAVERLLRDGEPPSAATRALFRYPELRVTYQPNAPPPANPRAYAKFSEAGVYATTVTQPADFRAYLLEQLEPLVSEYGATDRGRGRRAGDPIPLRDRERRRADARRRRPRPNLRASFPSPRSPRSATKSPTASS